MHKKLIAAVLFLFVATASLAMVHKGTQNEREGLLISHYGQEILVDGSILAKETFVGELADGKGDVTNHEYQGILLKHLLEDCEIEVLDDNNVIITSADNYSVEFSAEEVNAENQLYLAVEADGKVLKDIDGQDGGIQVIIFGDPNSKRCVRCVAKIAVK